MGELAPALQGRDGGGFRGIPKAHLVHEELQHKGGHAAVDADEEVDAGQGHVGSAGDAEEEGGWVHQGGDGPSVGAEAGAG